MTPGSVYDETRQLLLASDPRFGAAIALCYVQGWRVSEALGLAWQDIELETASVRLRRRATYADGVGMILGPTKTERTAGVQMIGPTVIALLGARRKVQNDDREKMGEAWPTIEYDG